MASQGTDWGAVADLVAGAESGGGVVGVSLIGPDGDRFTHRGDRRFRAASTVKIPIMVEICRQIERGERALDDPYTLRDDVKARGSGVLLHLHDGLTLTLGDLLYLMISISDNTATNILIDMAGMERVNATMRDLGMTNSTCERRMRGRRAEPGEPENWAAPGDYAAAVRAILDHRAAAPSSCDAMTALLEKQQNHNRISRYLPEREGIRWGSKTGSIAGVTNDAGFITTDKGTLIVSVYCEGLPDQQTGEKVISDISRAAMAATGIVEPLYTS